MNRRRASVLLFALSVPALAFAWGFGPQGNGKLTTETRRAEGFKRVTVEGSVDVEIKEGPGYAVSVTTDANLLPLITTEVRGEVLVVGQKEYLHASRGTKVEISLPELRGLALQGSGDAKVAGTVAARPLDLRLSGSGDLRYDGPAQAVSLDVSGSGEADYTGTAQSVKLDVSGSGDVKLQLSGDLEQVQAQLDGSGDVQVRGGTAKVLRVAVSGSGDLDVKGLPAQTVNVTMSGSGDVSATVAAQGQLDADLSGSGDLQWAGNAREKSISRTGSGAAHHEG